MDPSVGNCTVQPIDEDFKADNNIFNFIKLFRYALTADLLDFPSI
jgi:hypothetical protein